MFQGTKLCPKGYQLCYRGVIWLSLLWFLAVETYPILKSFLMCRKTTSVSSALTIRRASVPMGELGTNE